MRRWLLLTAIATLPACHCSQSKDGQGGAPILSPQATPSVQLDGTPLAVTVLKGEPARARGFGGVKRLQPGDALLRVWPRPLFIALGNHGYRVASQVAFCDAAGRVVEIKSIGPDEHLPERDRPWAKSSVRVQYALEMAPGRLAALGIDVGNTLALSADLARGADGIRPLLPDLPRAKVTMGGVDITVEIAHTLEARRIGLMFRDTIADDRGMLFVYSSERELGFWMKNCPVAIDVAYIERSGRIVSVHTMRPGWHAADRAVPHANAAGEAIFAIEMRGGWYAARGVKAGDHVTLPADMERWRADAEAR